MSPHPFPEDFYKHLKTHTLTGIKGGSERTTFLNIWMVNVDGRIFARSWGKSSRSWFTAFLEEGNGQIKYGKTVIGVTGKPCTDPALNARIDQAYRERYTIPANLIYVEGITRPEYIDYTMEFIPGFL